MRLLYLAAITVISTQASAQSIDGTIVEDELFNISSAASFLHRNRGSDHFDTRSGVLDEFCSAYPSSLYVMVLSSRISEEEAEQCQWQGARKVTEVFDRYRGYVYFNLDANPEDVLDQYRMWT